MYVHLSSVARNPVLVDNICTNLYTSDMEKTERMIMRISEEDQEALEVLAPKFGGNKSKAVRASIHFLRENFSTFEWQHPEIFGPIKSDGRKG